MTDNKEKAIKLAKAILLGFIAIALFESAIRPILIDLHPMFAERYELGRRFSTPAGVAYFITYILCYFVYVVADEWMRSYRSDQDERRF